MSEVFVHQAIHGLGPYNGFLHAFIGTFIKEFFPLNEHPSSNSSPCHTRTQALDPYPPSTQIIEEASAGTRHYRHTTKPLRT